MKKIIYIILFTVLGFLLQLLFHALVEIWYLQKLLSDFEQYSFGLSWAWWYQFHLAATIGLSLAGLGLGWWQGFYWWRRIYSQSQPLEKQDQLH